MRVQLPIKSCLAVALLSVALLCSKGLVHDVFAEVGGHGSSAGGGCSGNSYTYYNRCYNGGAWVYYEYTSATNPGDITIGKVYDTDSSGSVAASVSGTTVSSACFPYGGFWFFHHRYSQGETRSGTWSLRNGLYGARAISEDNVMTNSSSDVTSTAHDWRYNNVDHSLWMYSEIPSSVRVARIGATSSEIEDTYTKHLTYITSDPSWDDFSSSSDYTWFCSTETGDDSADTYFSGTTSGNIETHDKLEISSDGLTGRILNWTDALDGTYTVAFPANDYYTALFYHVLSRTDSAAVSSAQTSYEVEYQVNGGSWQTLSNSGNNSVFDLSGSSWISRGSGAVSGDASLAVGGSKTIISRSGFRFNAANLGAYTQYCQRLSYYSHAHYASISDSAPDSRDGWESSPSVCVIFKNPDFETAESPRYHNIDVTGSTSVASVSGATLVSGNYYSADSASVSVSFDHSLARSDASGYDESDPSPNLFNSARGSIYGNSSFSVSTDFHAKQTVGTDVSDVYPVGSPDAHSPLALSFSAASKSAPSPNPWASSATSGQTVANVSSLVAPSGEYTQICHAAYNEKAYWSVRYADIYRREVYYDSDGEVDDDVSGTATYLRTELRDTAPIPEGDAGSSAYGILSPSDNYYQATPACINVKRDWNFEIETASPHTLLSAQLTAGSITAPTFDIAVKREDETKDYITDLADIDASDSVVAPTVQVVSFVVRPSADGDHTSESSAVHGGLVLKSDPCAFVRSALGAELDSAYGCQFTTDSANSTTASHNNKGVHSQHSYSTTYSIRSGLLSVPTNLSAGSKFCIAIAISSDRGSHLGSDSAFLSSATCGNVATYPNFRVLGGSVSTNGGISTSLTDIIDGERKLYGSWADFAIIANGEVKKMASGASLAGGLSTSGSISIPCSFSPLSIANSACPTASAVGSAGVLGASSLFDTFRARYASDYSDANLTVIYRPADTYLISSNIEEDRSATHSGLDTLHQTIIIAKNIQISENVSRVDAWLLAEETIDTCAISSDGRAIVIGAVAESESATKVSLSSTLCQTPLQLNAPLSAQNVLFKRASGADPAAGTLADAAETVDFSPAAYLVSDITRQTGDPSTVYLKKLPPRY